ncbi:hypothetical protein Goarm_014162 [Gossypium armourianum]|uniref:Uncharacterized protein n=1 Tax=Gossypium armourianum TaxID=34283 RepID=A0A7J9J7X7_9ROSI|nr:hypothetical protein [Gossypium armourianum]
MANPNGNNNVNEQNDARFPLVVSPAPRSIRDYAIPHAKRLCTSIRFVTVETFYTSLRESIKGNLDTIGNGTLLSKSPKKAAKIIEDMTANSSQWISSRIRASQKKPIRVVEVDATTTLVAEMVALR